MTYSPRRKFFCFIVVALSLTFSWVTQVESFTICISNKFFAIDYGSPKGPRARMLKGTYHIDLMCLTFRPLYQMECETYTVIFILFDCI